MITPPSTLGELNRSLSAIGLPTIRDRAQLDALFERVGDSERSGRDRLRIALVDASNSGNRGRANTIAFLRTHITAVQAPASGQNRPAPAEGRAPAQQASTASRDAQSRQSHERESANATRAAHAPARAEARGAPSPTERVADRSKPDSTAPAGEHLKVRAYGRKAAFCAESDVTRGGVPTVRFEFASAVGEKEFDWKSKLSFQLTEDEIIEAAAALLGFVPMVNFKNHGDDKKWISIENQGKQVCLKAGSNQGNSMRIVPINIGRATALAAMIMRQLDAALFGVGRTGMMPWLLQRVTARLLTAEPRSGG